MEQTQQQAFNRALITIALPVSLQYMMLTSLNMIDTIMVGQLGDKAIASVGIGNQVYFLLSMLLLGVSSGSAIFVSQFYGKNDEANIKKVVGLSLLLAIISASLYFLGVFFFNQGIMQLFTIDPTVILLGSQYLKIVSLSYVVTAITTVFSSVSRSTENAKLPMRASFTAVILNTILNYIFIFGLGSLPALGVVGAAIATVISRLIELLIILYGVYHKQNLVAVKLKHLVTFSKTLFNRFVQQSSTIIIKDLIWGVGTTVHMIIYARMGTESVASINLLNTIRSIAFVLIMGLSNACIVLVGKKIGESSFDVAYQFALKFRNMTLGIAMALGFVLWAVRHIVLMPFNISATVYDHTATMLMIFSLTFAIEAYNMISVLGILRSGGDTKFCLYMDLVAVWVIGLAMALIGGILLKLPIPMVYAMVFAQEIFKAILLTHRIKSKKWIRSLVYDL